MKLIDRQRPEVGPAIAALGLTTEQAERFAHQLDRLLRRHRTSDLHARASVREIAAALLLRGIPGPFVVDTLYAAVMTHAREQGFTALSLLTREPHAAQSARRVARWAAELCAPDHPCLEHAAHGRREHAGRSRARESRPGDA